MVIASVHLADVGIMKVPTVLRKAPRAGALPGLLQANVASAAPLRTGPVPKLTPGRVGYVAFWEDDAALDGFDAHPVASLLASGFRARLEPLRMHGSWPGMPATIPAGRSVEYDGPAIVLTLARTNLTRVVPFLRTSAKAEKAAATAPGLLWGTALTFPPFMATCSLWRDAKSIFSYAYGKKEPSHSDAIDVDAAKPFHHESAFIRFRPYRVEGSLGGKNPLPEAVLA
jgi:hypothetical protein